MPNKGWYFWKELWDSNKRLGVAILISFILHVLFYGAWELPFPVPEDESGFMMQARLAPLPEKAMKKPPARPEVIPQPKAVEKTPPETKPKPEPELELESANEPIPADVAVPEETAGEEVHGDEVLAPEQLHESPQDFVAQAEEDEQAPAVPASPEYVKTTFDVLRGVNGSKIGQTVIIYRLQDDGDYLLSSETRSMGFASLFLPGLLSMKSTGRVTEQGLMPMEYAYEIPDRPDKNQYAALDWPHGMLTMKTAKGEKTEPLPEGTQDFLSFMYQFMFVPPLDKMQLHLTNGKRLRDYAYSFEGEEPVMTQAGEINTVHIARSGNDGEEKTELWLATDYRYIPVRIRKTDEDGSVIEQIATSLSADFLR